MDIDLHQGDCIEIMRSIKTASVDAIICDLPYGTTQCKWDTCIDFKLLWGQYLRVAKESAAIVLTSMQPFTSALIMSNPTIFKYDWVWEKGSATGFLNAKKQPLRAHESVCVFYRKQCTYNPQFTHGHERKTATKKEVNSECYGKAIKTTQYDSTDRYPRSVQFFSSDKQKINLHATQKPLMLMEYLVKTYSNEGDIVMDNCMGSGTTGVACKKHNRSFIGIESDLDIFKTARNRITDFNP